MYLILNLGLKSIRAIIFDKEYNIVSSSSKPLTTYIDNLSVEQCAEEWWAKGNSVINDSINQLNRPIKISTFTVTASSCCVVPVREDGTPLSRVIMVSDKRAFVESSKISSSNAYLMARQKSETIENGPTLMLPKIMWLIANYPEIYNTTKYYLSPNDYFIYRMARVAVTDTLNAEKCNYNSAKNKYCQEIFDSMSVPTEKLPQVVKPGTMVGKINNTEVNPALFNSNVAVSTYDAICAFVGAGPHQVGDGCDVSGTVTSLRVLATNNSSLNTVTNVFTQYEPTLDISICGASNNLGGGLIEWGKQAFYEDIKEPYGIMEAEAGSQKNNLNQPIFLPYLMGERAPLWNDNARGVFFGLGRQHRRADLIRAVFESAAFSVKLLCDEIEKTTQVGSISVSGGLARMNLINNFKADVLNKEIKVLSEFETTAIGAYVFVLIATGTSVSPKEVNNKTKVRQVIWPDSQNHEVFLERFELFKSVYNNLLPNFDKLASMEPKTVLNTKQSVENM